MRASSGPMPSWPLAPDSAGARLGSGFLSVVTACDRGSLKRSWVRLVRYIWPPGLLSDSECGKGCLGVFRRSGRFAQGCARVVEFRVASAGLWLRR